MRKQSRWSQGSMAIFFRVEDIAVSTKIPDGIKPLMEIIESEVNGYYGSGN